MVNETVGMKGMINYMDTAKQGGLHAYDKNLNIIRGRTFKIVCKRPKTGNIIQDTHILAIDGEVLSFQNFLKYETEY